MRDPRRRAARLLAALPAVAAGACIPYQPGSFAYRGQAFPGPHLTVGCLDVTVTAGDDARVPYPIVDYRFANRCDRAAPVDFGAVRVTTRDRRGREVPLSPYDPYDRIVARELDGRRAAHQRIAYRAGLGPGGGVGPLCFDVSAMTDRGAAGDRTHACTPRAPATPAGAPRRAGQVTP